MQTVEKFQIQFRVIFEELNLICFRCRYEMSNCLFESAYEETLRVCNCVPSFHQVALGEMPWLRICTGTKLKCMKKIFHGIGNYKLVSIPMNRIKWEFIFPFILYHNIFSTKCNTSVSKQKLSLNISFGMDVKLYPIPIS